MGFVDNAGPPLPVLLNLIHNGLDANLEEVQSLVVFLLLGSEFLLGHRGLGSWSRWRCDFQFFQFALLPLLGIREVRWGGLNVFDKSFEELAACVTAWDGKIEHVLL